MPSSSDFHSAQERVLRAYDELTAALLLVDLTMMRSTRKLVLDCYWTINELRTNPVQQSMEPPDPDDGPF